MENQFTIPPTRSSKTMASRRDVLKIAGFAVAAGATRSKAIDFTQDTSPPTGLTCEYLVDPLGVDTMHPRLSWMLGSAQRGARQTGYHILVAREAALLQPGKADVWDSGRRASDQSVLVPYAGSTLTAGGGAISGRCGHGMLKATSALGHSHPFGKWECSKPRIGNRPNG